MGQSAADLEAQQQLQLMALQHALGAQMVSVAVTNRYYCEFPNFDDAKYWRPPFEVAEADTTWLRYKGLLDQSYFSSGPYIGIDGMYALGNDNDTGITLCSGNRRYPLRTLTATPINPTAVPSDFHRRHIYIYV